MRSVSFPWLTSNDVVSVIILCVGIASWFVLLRSLFREYRRTARRPPSHPFRSHGELESELRSRGWAPVNGSATWWRREDDLGVIVRQLDGYAFLTQEV
jgi:hypothetical protein